MWDFSYRGMGKGGTYGISRPENGEEAGHVGFPDLRTGKRRGSVDFPTETRERGGEVWISPSWGRGIDRAYLLCGLQFLVQPLRLLTGLCQLALRQCQLLTSCRLASCTLRQLRDVSRQLGAQLLVPV